MRKRIKIPELLRLEQPNGVKVDFPYAKFVKELLEDNRWGASAKLLRSSIEIEFVAETLEEDAKHLDLRVDEHKFLAVVAEAPQFGKANGGYLPWAGRQFIKAGYIDAIVNAADVELDALDGKAPDTDA